MRPLQVYLDSSDFSRFADVLRGKGKPGDEALLEQLIQLSATGKAQFRYSSIHVLEAASLDAKHVDFALQRARAIELLCKRQTLECSTQLPYLELSSFVRGERNLPPRERPNFHGRNDRGIWFPSFGEVFADLNKHLEAMMGDPMAQLAAMQGGVMTRKMRRTKVSEGQKKETARRTLRPMWPSMEAKIRKQFPMSSATSSLWRRALSKDVAPASVASSLDNDLSDLGKVMPWLTPAGDRIMGTMPQWLRKTGDQLVDFLRQFRDAMDPAGPSEAVKQLHADWIRDQPTRDAKLAATVLSRVANGISKEQDYLQRRMVDAAEATRAAGQLSLNDLPSQACLVSVLAGHTAVTFIPSKTPRDPEKARSDAGDVSHACYIPYVDIMRVDGFAHSYMKKTADAYHTRLVDRIEDLPGVIAAM